MKTVLVTGGGGYVGSLLIPTLINKGYFVKVLDWFLYIENIFGKYSAEQIQLIKGDIRNTLDVQNALDGCDYVIHLACISNDPSAELNPSLSLEVNQDGFVNLMNLCKKANLEKFIFASSSSVYGISEAEHVYEDNKRVPVSLYNISKAWCEDYLYENCKDVPFVIVRPATLCGYAERIRLDLAVNLLSSHAIMKNKITIFGGEQFRPNLHIRDMVELYQFFLDIDQNKINHQIYNASSGNISINGISDIIIKTLKDKVGDIKIVRQESNDPRSYRVNCDKLIDLGFKPRFFIEDAVNELYDAFNSNLINHSLDSPIYNNTAMMKLKKVL